MYRETHVLLDDLAEAVAEGTRKEFMGETAARARAGSRRATSRRVS